MLWLKALGALMGFVYVNWAFVRFRLLMPYVIIGYLTFYYIEGNTRISVGPVNIYGWDILFLLAFLNVVYKLFVERVELSKEASAILLALGAYLFYLEFSELFNYAFGEGRSLDNLVRETVRNLYPLVAVAVIVNLKREDFPLFAWVTAGCASLVCFNMFLQSATGAGAFVTSSGTERYGRGAAVLFVQFLLAYSLLGEGLKRWWRLAMFGTGALAIVLISHRSGFLSAATILLFYAWYLIHSGRLGAVAFRATPVVAIGGALAVTFIAFSKPTLVESFMVRAGDIFNTEVSTSSDRLNKWQVALEATAENPLGGTKINLLPDYYGDNVMGALFGALDAETAHQRYVYQGEVRPWPPHNVLVNIVSRNGIIGLTLFLVFLFVVARQIMRKEDVRARFLLFAWIAADLVHLQFNNEYPYDAALAFHLATVVFPVLYFGRAASVASDGRVYPLVVRADEPPLPYRR